MSIFSCGCCNSNVELEENDLKDCKKLLPIEEKTEKNSKNGTENYLLSFGFSTSSEKLNINKLINIEKKNVNIENICYGESHSLMLISIPSTSKTKLFGIGSNENGQLGLPKNEDNNPKNEDKPKNIYTDWIEINKSLEKENLFGEKTFKIIDIAIGFDFSIVTVEFEKEKIKLFRFQMQPSDKFIKNKKIRCCYYEDFNQFRFGKIKKCSCFGHRILVLTLNNSLYIKGDLYNMDISNDYMCYKNFDFNVKNIYLGINHCLITNKKNDILYFIGHNEYGEFGIYTDDSLENEEYSDLKKNDFFDKNKLKIKKISVGARHTLVLCDNGDVYSFGDNSDGQCSGEEKVLFSPKKIIFPQDDNNNKEFIDDICCGFNHSIAKSNNKKVYFWGDSSYGKLGIEEIKTYEINPSEKSDMKIRNVVKMFAGPLQSGIIISE